jgi:hypothetical protein
MTSRVRVSGYLSVPVLFLLLVARHAGSNMSVVSAGGGGEGAHVDIIVKEVIVSPVGAHVGDVIRIDMRCMYWGDISNREYQTTKAEIRANGKVVGSVPFVYDYGASLGDEYVHSFHWDTRGFPPGKYTIRGDVFLWLDVTPYDNFLVVKEPVVLLAPGAVFPRGQEAGGAGVARNPSFPSSKE